MQRVATQQLISWKEDKNRAPLIIRGARQVGKSYLVQTFGDDYFEQCITINFELQLQFQQCFANDLNPKHIITEIELLTNKLCTPGKTLLFLDEIQECPRALVSLRYFKEQLPELHVIAAGSLLEFTLAETEFRFPVGRVSFLYLKPLSFYEFLLNLGENYLLEFLSNITLVSPSIPDTVHNKLLDLVRHYIILGGMPALVKIYIENKSLLEVHKLQSFLMQSYIQDFGKYATRAQQKYLQRLLQAAPSLIGKQFKYSSIDQDIKSREIKIALEQLQWAQILYSVHATPASGLPLHVNAKMHKFKLLFLDIGLMHNSFNLNDAPVLQKDHTLLHWGSIMEQMVGQELLAYQPSHMPAELFYWERDVKGSTAEVDYVISLHHKIIPIEVKSGKTGRLKSLAVFLKEHNSPFGLQISENPLYFSKQVLSLPFYLIHQLERMCKQVL